MKLVKESLNEVISFERGKNPLSTLGVGKKSLIENWLDEMKIYNYIINEDFSIDAYIVNLDGKGLKEFPEYIQFNKIIDGWFDCSVNHLISLRGGPKIINGILYCQHNNLSSLEGFPKYARGIRCYGNKVIFSTKNIRKVCKTIDILA